MDSKTLGILRKIRDSRCKPSSYIPGSRDLGLQTDDDDNHRRGLIDVAEDGLGTPVSVLLSAGREALEAEEARIRDSRLWRRFRRWLVDAVRMTAADIWRTIITTVVAAIVSYFVSRYCAEKATNNILNDFHGNQCNERADAGNHGDLRK